MSAPPEYVPGRSIVAIADIIESGVGGSVPKLSQRRFLAFKARELLCSMISSNPPETIDFRVSMDLGIHRIAVGSLVPCQSNSNLNFS